MRRIFRTSLLKGLFLVLIYIIPVIILCVMFAYQRMVSSEKRHLKSVTISILDRLVEEASPDDTSLPPETQTFLRDGIDFVSPRHQMGCVILGKSRHILWQSPELDIQLKDRHFNEPDRNKIFLLGTNGEEEWGDRWSNWRFLYRRQQGGFTVFVSGVHEFELVERAVEFVLVGTVLAMGLAFLGGWLHTQRILRPYEQLGIVMRQVRAGDLSARVNDKGFKKENLDLAESINSTLDELEESFNRISQFSSDAAHEMRTPLAAVCGTLEVALAKPRTVEEYEDLAAKCLEQMSGLKSLIEKLLLLARPGVLDMDNLPRLDLRQLAADQIETLELLAEERGVLLALKGEKPVEIQGDAALLGTMIRNLIDNAIKASPKGGIVRIHIDQSPTGNPQLKVKDEGGGMSPDVQRKIFERFFQVDQSRAVGKGLGLAMVRWIVESHRGTVEVDSQPGEGAEFIVSFPKTDTQKES